MPGGGGGGREGVTAVPASPRAWCLMSSSWSFRTGELSPICVLLVPVYLPPWPPLASTCRDDSNDGDTAIGGETGAASVGTATKGTAHGQ